MLTNVTDDTGCASDCFTASSTSTVPLDSYKICQHYYDTVIVTDCQSYSWTKNLDYLLGLTEFIFHNMPRTVAASSQLLYIPNRLPNSWYKSGLYSASVKFVFYQVMSLNRSHTYTTFFI